ncbi:hypothetical protein IAI18_19580 [Acetobacteraceae bacterium H6797]|nr:hypothetical protein [Acetobacteraceae bacterium H6797]
MTQRPGEALALPVATPDGSLRVTGFDGAPIQAPLQGGTLQIPAVRSARQIALGAERRVAPPPIPRPAALPQLPVLSGERPLWLDLGRDQSRSIAITLAQGGLYRLETLGRLHTKGEIGTAFLPGLDSAEANGAGQNMLIQRYLRAGSYRLTVGSVESAGRIGLLARPAPLVTLPPMGEGGLARAALPAGSGLAVPLTIAEAGRYRLELRGLGRPIRGRIEDAEGWPLLPEGDLSELEQEFRPGRYRIVVAPEAIESRLIARLTRLLPPREFEGHGPHDLPMTAGATNQWREPADRTAEREPDRWRFTLAGPAKVKLSIGDGMGAALHRQDGQRIANFAGGAPFDAELPAGGYEIRAQALGRNDRLDYKISLESDELQPDVPREVLLPAEIPFSIAEDRVVSLSTFGGVELRGVLRDAQGKVVAREEGSANDWNLSASRLLPAGRYTLALSSPAAVSGSSRPTARDESADEEDHEGEEESDDPPETASADPDEETSPATETTELRLALPAALPERPLAVSGEATLEGRGVHRLLLPAVGDGQLLVARAQADQSLALSLERRKEGEPWRSVATMRGQAPIVAVPGEAGASWRLSAWTESGEAAPIRLAARLASPSANPAPVEGLDGLFAAQVTLADEAALAPGREVLSSSEAGRPLAAASTILPQSRRLWLLTTSADPVALTRLSGERLVLNLPPGETATLPAAPAPRLWIASTGGEPVSLEAGRGMGLGTASSLALAGDAPLRLRSPAEAPLRVTLRALDPRLSDPRPLEAGAFRDSLAPGTAQPLTLPAGAKQLRLDLAPGTAAIAGWRNREAVTVWTGTASVSRLAEGEWTELLLVNTGETAAPVAVQSTPAATPLALAADRPLRRFFGAAGSVTLPVAAQPGQKLMLAGGTARFIGREGELREGAAMTLPGPGRVTIDHPAGAVMAWLEGAGATAFPAVSPRPAELPSRLPLSGEAMALSLNPGGPGLLQARSTAPVVLALGDDAPIAFPAGAEFHRYLPAATVLRLLSPQDGPLTGHLELSATPILPAAEGVGAPVMAAPGGTVLFGFSLTREATIGLGLSATPDNVRVRLLDEAGMPRGEGVAQLQRLPAGRYLIEARIPADGVATQLRPAVIGLTPRGDGPPEEIVRQYQAMAGITPVAAPR